MGQQVWQLCINLANGLEGGSVWSPFKRKSNLIYITQKKASLRLFFRVCKWKQGSDIKWAIASHCFFVELLPADRLLWGFQGYTESSPCVCHGRLQLCTLLMKSKVSAQINADDGKWLSFFSSCVVASRLHEFKGLGMTVVKVAYMTRTKPFF